MIPIDAAQVASKWLQANRAAIRATHDAKARAAAQKALDATLARMRAGASIAKPSGDPQAAAARELATLGRYHLGDDASVKREKTPWERFTDWLRQQFDKIWNAFGSKVRLGTSSLNVVGDLLLLLAGGALVFALARLIAGLTIERSRAHGVASALENGRNAHALYLQACALGAAGAFAEAARTLFLAAVTALDLRGVVRDDAAATVGEMRRTLRSRNPDALAHFDDVAASFVAAAYAERAVERPEWERALEGYRALARLETPT